MKRGICDNFSGIPGTKRDLAGHSGMCGVSKSGQWGCSAYATSGQALEPPLPVGFQPHWAYQTELLKPPLSQRKCRGTSLSRC